MSTAVIFGWQSTAVQELREGNLTSSMLAARQTVTQPLDLGSAELLWYIGATQKTATVTDAGVLQGNDATGFISSAGELVLRPTLLPDIGSALAVTATTAVTARTRSYSGAINNNIVEFTLSADTLAFSVQIQLPTTQWGTLLLHDDGAGTIRDSYNSQLGTVNYTTGDVSLTVITTQTRTRQVFSAMSPHEGQPVSYGVQEDTYDIYWNEQVAIVATYSAVGDSTHSTQDDLTITDLTVDFSSITDGAPLLPGGVRWILAGTTYFDDGQGNLYEVTNPLSGDSAAVGSIDYATAVGTITDWPVNHAPTGTYALRCQIATAVVNCITGRLIGGALRPGSFQVRATTAADSQTLTATAALDGSITGDGIRGQVTVGTGIYHLEFGTTVLASSLTQTDKSQAWYHQADVDQTGHIWKPQPVLADTVLLNAVALKSIPLDKTLIDMETARLPADGRVPIFDVGRPVVVHNTQSATFPSPLIAGQVVDLERTDLAAVTLRDAGGTLIPANRYSVSLALGTVTMASPLDLTGFTQPLQGSHTVEVLARLLDAQLDGTLNISLPLGHDYPQAGSYVSSAYIAGDRFAHVRDLFDQKTWTEVWSDTLIGDPCTANYDSVDFPIEVTNDAAIEEDWALLLTSTSQVQVIGRTVGDLGAFSILSDIAPVNPLTLKTYFLLHHQGWGGGWTAGNALRFHTVAAAFGVHFFRTVNPSPPYLSGDEFSFALRGNLLP
jgi:hypothetical protein